MAGGRISSGLGGWMTGWVTEWVNRWGAGGLAETQKVLSKAPEPVTPNGG